MKPPPLPTYKSYLYVTDWYRIINSQKHICIGENNVQRCMYFSPKNFSRQLKAQTPVPHRTSIEYK